MKTQDGNGKHDDGGPSRPQNEPPHQSHPRALAISAAVVVACFLVHILILVLVEPLKVLHLTKLNAYATSSIPLAMGLVFLVDAITHFRQIEARSAVHLVPFILAVVFGGLSVQGLLGFMIFLVRHPPAF